ncbi:MAG: T9SS type A sorting domain-containing protein [Bacteroidia bacterium]
MTVSIYDVEGKKVAQQELPATEAGRHRTKLDISSLRPGIYAIRTPDGVAKLQRM